MHIMEARRRAAAKRKKLKSLKGKTAGGKPPVETETETEQEMETEAETEPEMETETSASLGGQQRSKGRQQVSN